MFHAAIRLSMVKVLFHRAVRPYVLGIAGLLILPVVSYPGIALGQQTQGTPPEFGLKLRPQDTLIDPSNRAAEATPSFGMADHIHGTVDTDTILEGHAELRRAKGVLKADNIHYFQPEDEVFATGSVRLYENGGLYTGPELHLRLDDNHGYFVAPDYAFGNSGARGYADRINFVDKQRSELINPIYTTCPPGNYEWYLVADTMHLDQGTKEGESRNAVIYFEGVPILASPWLTFPLSSARRSGFLPPTLSLVSTNGAEFILPYYWNIAPNHDLTIFPNFMSKRGLMLGGDFRFLEPTTKGEIRLEDIEDHEAGRNRYSTTITDYWSGTGSLSGFSSYVNLNRVSDPNYFNDFSKTFAASSTRTLPRDAEVTYTAPYWYLTGRVLTYQTLEQTNSFIVPPFDKVPELQFHAARLDYGGFDLNLDADLTRFSSPGLVEGDRFVFNPSVSYPIVGPGYFFTPKISYNAASYNLTDTAPGAPSSLSRNLPAVSVDSGLIYERDTHLFGTAFRQTLEPRLFYVRRPFQNQDDFPNFDSALPDFNFSQLFSDNSFVGYDRLADENQLTAAVTTRYLNPDTGAELLRAAIGQRYFLSPQKVTLPGGTPVNTGKSDFLALVSGQVLPTVVMDSGIDYSPAAGGMERSNVGVSWSPGVNKELSFEYRYLRSQFDQYDISGQWPLGGGFYGVGRVNFSSRDRKVIESLAGIEYKGCCWVIRVAAQQFVTGLTTSQTSIFIQLELNGFSRIGSSPFDALKRNVVGYQPFVIPTPSVSPYNHFE